MTLKTAVSDPLDAYSLAEWRTELCALLGIAYSNQSTAWQTMFDSIVAETESFLLKRAKGQPWGERESSTLTVTAGVETTYSFPSDFRQLIWIREETSTQVLLGIKTDKDSYGNASDNYGATHPWAASTNAYWFKDGANNASPPVQQWKRVGADNTGATIRIYYIPYFSLSTPELPADERSAARTYALKKLKLLSGDLEHYAALRQDQEDELHATETLGRTASTGTFQQGTDDEFSRVMG